MKGQKVLLSHKSDEWETPKDLFDKLNDQFHFNFDAAATKENTLCHYYASDALNITWTHQDSAVYTGRSMVWCNPPYSKCKEFVKKAYEEWQDGSKIVMLLPARTDVRWFQDYILPEAKLVNTKYYALIDLIVDADIWRNHSASPKVGVEFIKGRLKFSNSKNSAPFPSMLIYFL